LQAATAALTDLRMDEPIGRSQYGRQMHGLGTDVAEVRWVLRIALHADHGAVLNLGEEPASHAAVGAHGLPPSVGGRESRFIHGPGPRENRGWRRATRNTRPAP